MKKIKIYLVVSLAIICFLYLIFVLGVHLLLSYKEIRVFDSISKNDYKLIETEYSVSIPNNAVIKSLSDNRMNTIRYLTVTLVMAQDEEEKFINNIKIDSINDEYLSSDMDKIIIAKGSSHISFKCYKPKEGNVKIVMYKSKNFSKEMLKWFSSNKYHKLNKADTDKEMYFVN